MDRLDESAMGKEIYGPCNVFGSGFWVCFKMAIGKDVCVCWFYAAFLIIYFVLFSRICITVKQDFLHKANQ